MKTRLMAAVALAAAMFAGTLYARTALYTEKVDGLTWHYQIENGKATIHNGTEPAAHYYDGSDYDGSDPVGVVTIPSKLGGKPVAVIGDNAFSDCDDITAVTIPATVTTIGAAAFNGCDGLTSVKIPDSVTIIGEAAFSGCDSLKCVDFGKKVAYIAPYAFADCELLRSLVFRGNEPTTVGVDAFDGVAEECKVYVAKNAKWSVGGFSSWQGMEVLVGDCMAPVAVLYHNSDMAKYGKISGGNDIFAVGKKITLKATPEKNCVFGGWYDLTSGTEQLLGYSQSLSYTVTGSDAEITAKFYLASDDARDFEVESDDYDSEDDGYVWIPANGGCLIVYTDSEPKLTVKGLPPGVKYNAKKFAIEGKATKPGKYSVTVTGTNKSVKKATDKSTCTFDIYVPNFVDEDIDVADIYPNEIGFIPGDFTWYTIPGAAGCNVTGLPAGMKWTAKEIVDKTYGVIPANSVYGAPTKPTPRESKVFFTKTVDGVKHTATSTFVVDSFRVLQINVEGNGTTSGGGAYAANAKAKLAAKPSTGWVFGGWYEDGELLSQSPSYTYVMGISDTTYLTAKFITFEEDADQSKIEVTAEDVVDDVSAVISPKGGNSAEFHCGVYANWHIGVKAPSATTVKVSKLPAGLKFTAKDIVDSKTKEVTVKANSIYGVPTKDGTTDVTITLTTAGKKSFYYDVSMTVDPLDPWAYGQFEGLLVNLTTEEGGTASVTVSENGKISGKYICQDGKTWTISAPHYSQYVHDKRGGYYADVTFKCGKEEVTQKMMVWDSEDLIGEPNVGIIGDLGMGELLQTFWKTEYWKNVGKKINNQQLRIADKVVTVDLTFSSSGSVKIAIDYAGYKATCSSTLIPVTMPDEDPNGSFEAFVFFCFPKNEKKHWAGSAGEFYLKWDGKAGTFVEIEEDDDEEDDD